MRNSLCAFRDSYKLLHCSRETTKWSFNEVMRITRQKKANCIKQVIQTINTGANYAATYPASMYKAHA